MRFITVAIHTYEKALALRSLLESEGIDVELNNVNLEVPGFSSGVRVRRSQSLSLRYWTCRRDRHSCSRRHRMKDCRQIQKRRENNGKKDGTFRKI